MQAAQKGPDARRRMRRHPEAYSLYVERVPPHAPAKQLGLFQPPGRPVIFMPLPLSLYLRLIVASTPGMLSSGPALGMGARSTAGPLESITAVLATINRRDKLQSC